MFYSQFILAKKGPLGTIWIAAHLERKLRKNQVADTDIGVSVDSILFPEVPIALRLSSHLLLGVVRIYSRKVNYLFDDCSEALLKVKQAFRSTAVDLPPEESTAPYHSITLPETFDLDDFELPDNDIFQSNYVDHHVSTREQITLQDTMEGVVYTTSQFGLDERFGDGDASQIGLDLDEGMLIDKDATLEHDGCSASPQVSPPQLERPHKNDERKEEIDGLAAAAGVSEHAQGPSTPGLEEPNLFGAQVDQIINETDYHNSSHLVSMKSTQEDFPTHQMEKDVNDCSFQNDVKHVGVGVHHEDNDGRLVELDSKKEDQEQLACMVVTKDQENLVHNDHCLTSSPLMVSSNLVPECTGGMISSSDIPEKVENLHDGVLINNEPVVAPLDQTFRGVSVNERVACPSCSHVTSDQEDLSCKLLSNMNGSQGLESDGHLEDNRTLSKHEVLNDVEISKNEGQSCSFDEAQVYNALCTVRSPSRSEVVDVEAQASQELKEAEGLNQVSEEAVQSTESHLRPCSSHLSRPFVSSVEGEKCPVTDASDPALGFHETIEPSVCKRQPDLDKSDVRLGSEIYSDTLVESINKSAASDMPEPEKMLSLAHHHVGEANDLLMESTPEGISGGHTSTAGVECISGKKRSFTESTLTVQSVDLAESYGGIQSKRTAESIPDDDDLLSSILVGRRSSVLKMKPSPAAPEMVSLKRSRSATRTSALKRKVLVDDMMVLHGDTIRQQLTNTEDIRRIRKKAPCTHHEVLMIQRQFMEDEIFHEPIFTGSSANLIVLQNEKFDLTGIKVCDYSLDSSFMEVTNDQESYSRTNNNEIHGVEGNIEHMSVQPQGDAEAQPTEIPVLSESHQSEVNCGSHDIDAHGDANIISHMEELESSQNAATNNVEGIIFSDAENCSVGPRLESSSLTEVFVNNTSMPNDFVASLDLMDKNNEFVGSMHTEISSMPTAKNLKTFPVLEDEFVEDKGYRSEAGATEIAEHDIEIRTEVQTDGSEKNNLYPSLATDVSKETDEHTNNQASFNGDIRREENENSMPGGLNEDRFVVSGVGCDDKDLRSGFIDGENTKVDCLDSVALVADAKETSLNDEENPVCQETGVQSSSTMCAEFPAIESPFVDHNDENVIVANDTGFLDVGDDDIIEDDDDFMPCAEGTHLENSGWSSRTRAVAKYLQALFDKEDLHGRKNLHLDNILAGKTRKEASRMFFETLVLKTRDYVHVEQTKPFANINIKPRMKLMKSDF